MEKIFHLWVYLETTPLLGLAVTLVVWHLAGMLANRLGNAPLANPMLLSVIMLSCLLIATDTPYSAYFQGAQYVHFLLGPATVALALPMYANLRRISRSARAIIPALLAGSVVAASSAMLLARWLGAPSVVVRSLGPKSVTTPIAMGIAEQIGGQPSLAAVFVLLTGLTSIILIPPTMKLFRIKDMRAQGLAAGMAGHGLATARMLLISETAGAFGGLAIGLNGLITAIIVPLLATFLAP